MEEQIHNKRCDAMIERGITDPNSQKGIQCCLDCPYEYCVIFEKSEKDSSRLSRGRKAIAIRLRELKVSVNDIALVLGISEYAVKRYLKKKL